MVLLAGPKTETQRKGEYMSTDGYSESRVTTGRFGRLRRFRRTQHDRLPFIPYGLIPLLFLGLLTLYALFIFAAGSVQNPTERAAQDALNDMGAAWATPTASGQVVTLRGTPPSRDDGAKAMAAVRKARAQTPFGPARPVTRVRDRFTWPTEDVTTQEPPAETDVDLEPSLPAQPPVDNTPIAAGTNGPDWQFRLVEGVLTLDGEIPDSATRAALMTAARAQIDPPRIRSVEDSLLVTGTSVPEGFRTVAQRGIQTISRCDRGESSLTGGQFSLTCELPQADAENVEALARAPLPFGRIGTINMLPNEVVAACEGALADLLNTASIEFASSSALINTSSSGLLDDVAEAAASCPGTLRIEGHTDNTGRVAFNADLSARRAQAVRAALIRRGVPEGRLVAQGFGSVRPVADNNTEAGRARNRRIEIRVVRASD